MILILLFLILATDVFGPVFFVSGLLMALRRRAEVGRGRSLRGPAAVICGIVVALAGMAISGVAWFMGSASPH